MRFSIVVPTYNEERDIAATLRHLLALEWRDVEILVVDDSTDATPEIVNGFADPRVRVIRPERPEGRCGARNLGVLQATGEIVVILNADVHLPPDFLGRLAAHYEQGADWVLFRSVVENLGDLFARYVEAVGRVEYHGPRSRQVNWTEGFSCRRKAAIDAGLFPTGFAVPLCAGEDGHFGEALRTLGFRKVTDLDIVCTHVAPATLGDYWRTQKGRGRGGPQVRRFLEGWSLGRIATRAGLRVVKTAAMTATVLPMLWVAFRYAGASPHGRLDTVPFCWAWLVSQIAFSAGEWESLAQIRGAEAAVTSVADSEACRS